MVIIEFFGPSGSGKSYFKKKLIKKYFYSSKTYDYKSINLNSIKYLENKVIFPCFNELLQVGFESLPLFREV
mgnify:CR=1 FL=1